MCAGKSTISKMLAEEFPGVFHISYDKLKWFIVDYSLEKYSGKGIVSRLLSALVKQVAIENLSIIVEGDLNLMRNHENYKKIALDNNMKFIEVNIEAPLEVVSKRFEERVRNSIEQNKKISVTTEDGMKRRYDAYHEKKRENLPTFDSSKMTAEEIASAIRDLINNSLLSFEHHPEFGSLKIAFQNKVVFYIQTGSPKP